MLESKLRSHKELQNYMAGLKEWLAQERETPAEKMEDFFASRLDIYEGVHLDHWQQEYDHIAEYFDDGVETLLDIGCGTGLELASMFRRFASLKVTGIDLSRDMLGKLREAYPGKPIELIEGDYFVCPLGQGGFGAALAFETLHHFKPEKKQVLFDRLYDALAQGGSYVECDYIACCAEEEALCLEQYEYKRERDRIPEDTFVHLDIPLTLEHETELMERAGFTDIRVLYENCGTMIIKAKK